MGGIEKLVAAQQAGNSSGPDRFAVKFDDKGKVVLPTIPRHDDLAALAPVAKQRPTTGRAPPGDRRGA